MSRRTRRGQALVLFALMLLLLVLLVLMTLSLAIRTREGMELQTLADAAAYSNSVATARTMNSLALLNRAEISLNIASIGAQSLLSWSGLYRGVLNELEVKLQTASCPDAQAALWAVIAEQERVAGIWDPLDVAAAAQVRNINVAEAMIQGSGLVDSGAYTPRSVLHERLVAGQEGLRLVDEILRRVGSAPGGDGLSAPAAINDVNLREIRRDGTTGALCDDWQGLCSPRMNQWEIAMGSRGFAFVTGREGSAELIRKKLTDLLGPTAQVTLAASGAGYWEAEVTHGDTDEGGDRLADDHARGTLTFPGCGAPIEFTAFAYVHSANMARPDWHVWTGGGDPDNGTVALRHTLISPIGDGNWPLVTDYNDLKLADTADLFGQPKNLVVVQRDLTRRARDPWELLFDFRLSPDDQGARYDGTVGARTVNGVRIDRVTAVATGLAYYHREGHWREPPNLVNPFWRATLVPSDVDGRASPEDVPTTLEASGSPHAAEVYRALLARGFEGVH